MGKSTTKAKNKYNDKNYDRIPLVVPKGTKEKIKTYAESKGFKSLNAYINYLIVEDMKIDED